jgi:hypothetical protein
MSVYRRIALSCIGYLDGLAVLVGGICGLYLSFVFLFFSHVAMGLLLLVLGARALFRCGL